MVSLDLPGSGTRLGVPAVTCPFAFAFARGWPSDPGPRLFLGTVCLEAPPQRSPTRSSLQGLKPPAGHIRPHLSSTAATYPAGGSTLLSLPAPPLSPRHSLAGATHWAGGAPQGLRLTPKSPTVRT